MGKLQDLVDACAKDTYFEGRHKATESGMFRELYELLDDVAQEAYEAGQEAGPPQTSLKYALLEDWEPSPFGFIFCKGAMIGSFREPLLAEAAAAAHNLYLRAVAMAQEQAEEENDPGEKLQAADTISVSVTPLVPRMPRVTEVGLTQADYTYYQCPECGFSTVLPTNPDRVVHCAVCQEEAKNPPVVMNKRAARTTDKPHGRDARTERAY